ncbi:MAG: C-GCAxxG-C-C family protein, partial [Burkholderiaceae bacterium]|nr:C-GCAxxG-C-C family protein [Burkholderiaceae bacterium]
MTAEIASKIRASAEASFASGLFCAESVLLALARDQGLENEFFPKIASGFCNGMARTCGTCGAVTGAIMGLGLFLGRSQPDESIQPVYVATERFIGEFERAFGSRDCHVLLG